MSTTKAPPIHITASIGRPSTGRALGSRELSRRLRGTVALGAGGPHLLGIGLRAVLQALRAAPLLGGPDAGGQRDPEQNEAKRTPANHGLTSGSYAAHLRTPGGWP